ncbi:MAG TPA: oligopeptide/dipeptide ABC transporter ATP-binding protein [Desulfuromonadaceae bacterium]|jgi:peptide/nickel transport system ATP-binding protein
MTTYKQAILSGMELRKHYQTKPGPGSETGLLTALDGTNLDLYKGETLGIAGESGCGKSTLGKILSGLLMPDKGKVLYNGTSIGQLSPLASITFRRQTQMIFQDPFSSLNPRMQVGEIISEPLVIAGTGSAASRRSAVQSLMSKVGLSSDLYNRFPHEFSGGQRQRIGIARALASAPTIIIADEPVSSLDISIQAQIINLLQSMKAEFQLSMIIISHDLSVLRHICDRILIMYLGIIVESAEAADLFKHCQHPYTEALISAIPKIGQGKKEKGPILKDDLPSPLVIPPGCRFHPRCRYAEEICRQQIPPLEEKKSGHMAACHFSKSIFGE